MMRWPTCQQRGLPATGRNTSNQLQHTEYSHYSQHEVPHLHLNCRHRGMMSYANGWQTLFNQVI